MVEYGGGIENGPAGQVSGGGGAGGGTDLFAPVSSFVDRAVHTIAAMSPGELVLVAVVVFVGLLLLRRAL
jgi:hypothetical protein